MSISNRALRVLTASVILLLGLLLMAGDIGQAGGKKKKAPEQHWAEAAKQLKQAKKALADSLSDEASERKLEKKVINELEKAIEFVGKAQDHLEKAHKADKKN